MARNQDKTKNDIYNYLKSNGYDPVLKSTNGKEVSVPDEAEVIEFQFKVDGENYGTAAISLDNEGQMKVFYSDDIRNSPSKSEHGEVTWNKLIPALRQMTFGKTKSFELDDMDNLEYDMAKREHSKKLEEGYYPMGKKASYSDNIPECKIVIKHNRNIEEGEQRYRNIHQIFIENALGERFLAPTVKPGLARVYARHIAEGGKVNDDKWNHITGLCEEYSKMAGFIRATRNGQFNEDTQRLVTAGTEHYISLRESLHKLAGKRGYNNYFESWAPPLMESEGDEDLSEMFMNSSLDPRIESVIPILNRLNKTISENQEIKQVVELEEWADDIAEGIFSHDVERAFPNGKASGVKSHPMKTAVIKTNKPIGTRVADIGKGGKEHNVRTDREWDKQKGVAEGRPEDLPGIDYDRPGDTPRKQSNREHNPYPFSKEEDDDYFREIFRKKREAAAKAKEQDKEQGVVEGEGNFEKALDTLSGSWSGWHKEEDMSTPDIDYYSYDDGEGNFYADGSIEHNLKTGEVTVDYHGEYDDEVKGTFKNMGDAMRALRGGNPGSHGGRAPNFDRLGQRTPPGPDDLRKTDRTGRKGTIGGGYAGNLKGSIQANKGRLGPKGVLPEQGGLEEDIGPQQKAVGQLGATAKVNAGGTVLGNPERSQRGLRGKLVGTSESVDPLARIIKLSK